MKQEILNLNSFQPEQLRLTERKKMCQQFMGAVYEAVDTVNNGRDKFVAKMAQATLQTFRIMRINSISVRDIERSFGRRDQNAESISFQDQEGIIQDRWIKKPANSGTVKLLEKGPEEIAKKVREEAAEVVLETMDGTRKDLLTEELQDFSYNTLVLLVRLGIPFGEILIKAKGQLKEVSLHERK